MKKFLIGFISLIVIALVGLQIADKVVKGGDDYYVQVTTDGERIDGKDSSGNPYVDYKYSLPGYDKDGTKKQLEFNAAKDRPLRREAFLKVTWNKKKALPLMKRFNKSNCRKRRQKN